MACLGSVTAVVVGIEAGAVAAGTRSCVKKSTVLVGVRRFVRRKSARSREGVGVTSGKRKMMHLRDIGRGRGPSTYHVIQEHILLLSEEVPP